MTKKEYYQYELGLSDDWPAYLLEHSNLPGPRANLELMQAFVEMGSERDFIPLLDHTPETAPKDNPLEFLAFCGTVGLGELVVNGMKEYLLDLRRQASDPRWRIREAVALGLQIIGKHDFPLLETICREWAGSNPPGLWAGNGLPGTLARRSLLEMRAVAAGICEPSLLADPHHAEFAIELLEGITQHFSVVEDRKTDDFRILCSGLSYCWSVAIAALPEKGKPVFERLARSRDRDTLRVVRENLKKKRLVSMDPEWVRWMQSASR
jgi:hypothetical protein